MHLCILVTLFVSTLALTPRTVISPGATWSLLAWGFSGGGHDSTDGMKVVDVDIDTQSSQIAGLKATGHIVMCYFSAGTVETFRPDYTSNMAAWNQVAGATMKGWPEPWLDIRKLSQLQQLMTPRFLKAVQYGCQAIEPDNTDCFSNSDCWQNLGFASSDAAKPYQITYNKWLAATAHQNGLAIALKNTVDLVDTLSPYFDCAINEQCLTYGECDAYTNFVSSGKPVFHVEYISDPSFCTSSKQYSIQTKYCPTGSSDGICADSSSWTNCFSPVKPLPPTLYTSAQAVVDAITDVGSVLSSGPQYPTDIPGWGIAIIVLGVVLLVALLIVHVQLTRLILNK